MEGHEVYICYDEKDQLTADAICHALEDNTIKCWLKSRDAGINHVVEEIMDAINNSQVMILVFSDFAKHSNYVNTEVDIAFTEKIPILVFKIDESKLDGGLEFFLGNTHWLDAYPDFEVHFESLVRDTSKLLEKPISKPELSDETEKLKKKAIKHNKEREKRIHKIENPSFLSRFKIPIIAVVIILILAVGVFAFTSMDDGVGGTSEAEKNLPNITMKITDFHVDDVSKQDSSWNYSYFVGGTINPLPKTPEDYKIMVDFYDKSGTLVDSSETQLNEAQIVNNGYLFGSAVSNSNNIKRVDVQLINENGIVVAQSESNIK